MDGIYFNVRLEDDCSCILVVMGATADGKKELVAVQDGYRESEQSWRELLLDLKARGLAEAPLSTHPSLNLPKTSNPRELLNPLETEPHLS